MGHWVRANLKAIESLKVHIQGLGNSEGLEEEKFS